MLDAPFEAPRRLPFRITDVLKNLINMGLGELFAPVASCVLATVRLMALLFGLVSLWTVATYTGPHQFDVVSHALVRAVLLGLLAAGAARLRSRLKPRV